MIQRWILGFVVPRRAVIQSKSEELARAAVWCLLPLALAWVWARYFGKLSLCGGSEELQTVFSGLFSDSFFQAHRQAFFVACDSVFWMNWSLLWRLYFIVIAGSSILDVLIKFYGSVRRNLNKYPRAQSALAFVVLPRVSEWHVLLSRMLLPSPEVELFVDVLTKSDNLYKGRLSDKTINSDGSLASLTLEEPSKFRREQYLAASQNGKADPSGYWSTIPGEMFIIMASDITTMNVRYVNPQVPSPEILKALQDIIDQFKIVQSQLPSR